MKFKIKKDVFDKAVYDMNLTINEFCEINKISPSYISRLKDRSSPLAASVKLVRKVLFGLENKYKREEVFFTLN